MERNDIAEGEVWPEEPPAPPWCEECKVEGHAWPNCPHNPDAEELGPCPFGPPCTDSSHHELARIQAADRAADQRRHWRQQKSRHGRDPGLFC